MVLTPDAVTHAGQPHVKLGIDNVPIMLAAAVLVLYLKKPLSVSRTEMGGFFLDLPVGGDGAPAYTLQQRVRAAEARAGHNYVNVCLHQSTFVCTS